MGKEWLFWGGDDCKLSQMKGYLFLGVVMLSLGFLLGRSGVVMGDQLNDESGGKTGSSNKVLRVEGGEGMRRIDFEGRGGRREVGFRELLDLALLGPDGGSGEKRLAGMIYGMSEGEVRESLELLEELWEDGRYFERALAKLTGFTPVNPVHPFNLFGSDSPPLAA